MNFKCLGTTETVTYLSSLFHFNVELSGSNRLVQTGFHIKLNESFYYTIWPILFGVNFSIFQRIILLSDIDIYFLVFFLQIHSFRI